jgi:opine dehydrogenase
LVPIDLVTADLGEAVPGADLIMLVVPAIAHQAYARALAPLLDANQPIFLNPGHTGGALHLLHELRRAGFGGAVRCCETVTLTYIARMAGPATVNIYSFTTHLRFAALPGRHTEEMLALIAPLYPHIVKATSVLETGFGNINAVFHPPGMIMNAGAIERSGEFLFYREGITASVGRVTAAVDAERLAVARALGVPAVPFLDLFYEAGLTTKAARDGGSISRACEESAPNRTIKAPPSLDHRYIHEDVGYGLVPMAELGRLAGVATPAIDALIALAGLALGIDYRSCGLTLERLGLAGKTPAELSRLVRS